MEEIPSIELPSRPSIRITGRVYPISAQLTFRTEIVPELVVPSGTYAGLNAKFQLSITDSELEINCHLNRIVESDLNQVLLSAFELSRTAVDLIAFSTGRGLTVILDQAIYADGSVVDIHLHNAYVAPLCTAFSINPSNNSLDPVLGRVVNKLSLMTALHDLTETIAIPHRVRLNCARAIEALAQIVSPEEKNDSQRWKNLRQALNLSQAYLMVVTEHSKGPRHGSYFEAATVSDQEIQIRAWKVMNRFFEYQKRGDKPLPISEFPLL
jgi:hypothetical protein